MDRVPGKNIVYRGVPVTPGIAIGRAYILKPLDLDAVSENKFPLDDVNKERERFWNAINNTREQLIDIRKRVSEATGKEAGDIFSAHIKFIEDKTFIDEIIEALSEEEVNIEYIIARQIKNIENSLESIGDTNDHIRESFIDIQDVYHRLLRNLMGIEHIRVNPQKKLGSPVVVIAEKLIPSDIALFDPGYILGLIIEYGSRTSHVVIISRSLNVPTVIRVPGASSVIKSGDKLIIDGYSGAVYVNPDEKAAAKYEKKKETEKNAVVHMKSRDYDIGRCETKDGRYIRLMANVSNINDLDKACVNGAEGIGLVRSEIYYMSSDRIPDDDTETAFYRTLLERMPGYDVTVRLLDLGADKMPSYLSRATEKYSPLGIRGIRYLLRNRGLFEKQVRCIIKASVVGRPRILIPFVTTLEDLEQARAVIDSLISRLSPGMKIPVGIMVEIPSVALSLEKYMVLADFISIGTNDLAQYVFAASREEPEAESYHQPLHPVILNIIKNAVLCAEKYGREISVCGEIGGDPSASCLLAGLGITNLSVQPGYISAVKKELKRRSYGDLKELGKTALVLDRTGDVMELLKKDR
ncbi:MAG: phosphoenolpyruvate--protein phosphotransferase [Elusimicrobia bacterium]|nr:phosphoenolpyruvate--protein phosphotransferase [Elusimicrobiota bacterium]